MNATLVRKRRINSLTVSIASVVLAVVLIGGLAGMLSISRDDSAPAPVAPDTTTLVLDREGADLLAPALSRPDIDSTSLNLDRDGADVIPAPAQTSPDATTLNLDRDGADIP